MILAFEKWIIGGADAEEAELLRQHMTKPKEELPEIPVVLLTQIDAIAKRIGVLVQFHSGSDIEALRALDLSEALLNGLSHGNESDCTKAVTARLIMREIQNQIELILHVDDAGTKLFSVQAEIDEALLLENLERPNGRGLLLMRDCFGYKIDDPVLLPDGSGKRVTIKKTFAKKSEKIEAV